LPVRLVSKISNLHMWSQSTNVTDRQTDDIRSQDRALHHTLYVHRAVKNDLITRTGAHPLNDYVIPRVCNFRSRIEISCSSLHFPRRRTKQHIKFSWTSSAMEHCTMSRHSPGDASVLYVLGMHEPFNFINVLQRSVNTVLPPNRLPVFIISFPPRNTSAIFKLRSSTITSSPNFTNKKVRIICKFCPQYK